MSPLWLVGGAALAGALAGSWLARLAARRLGIVNDPNPIVPQHTQATAYLGGVGVLAGLAVGWGVAALLGVEGLPGPEILVPALLFCALGLVDDLRPFGAAGKLAGQLGIATLAVAMGLRLDIVGVPLVDGAIAVLWIASVVNAFNFTDVCDGLVGGLGAAFFLAWAMLSPVLPVAGWIGLAACVGFLPFNVPRASMFLGDAGSHLVGFLVAALAISLPTGPLLHLPAMVLLALVPVYELVFITLVRLHKGLPWWKGSPDHFSLRLQAAGWSRWQVDGAAWALMGAGGVAGLLLPASGPVGWVAIALVVVAVAAVATRYLLRWEVVR